MRKGLLGRLAENNAAREAENGFIEESLEHNEELVSFSFEGKSYYVAIRDNVLVFDANMLLIHTLTKEEIVESTLPLINKVHEIIDSRDEPCVKLFVKRDGSFEKLSFYNRFDAIFILKKLRRVASRPDENISELFIEDNGALIEHHSINPQRRRTRSFFKNRKESDAVVRLSNVEDALENIINESVNHPDMKIDKQKIDNCIELLESLKSE